MRFPPIISGIFLWVFIFVLGTMYEFAIVLYFFQKWWTPSTALNEAAQNVLAVLIVGLALGILYAAIASVLRLTKVASKISNFFMSPATIASATFITIPVGFNIYGFFNSYSTLIRWIVSIVACLLCYVLVYVVWRKFFSNPLRRVIGRRSLAVIICCPILFIVVTPIIRNHGFDSKPSSNGKARNVVLISIDTLRFDHVSSYNPVHVQTPVLDEIAREGARFEVAISSIPQTGPSHISMLTGLSPLDHRIWLNGHRLPSSTRTIASQLREAGFQTGAFVSGFPLKNFNCNLQTGFGVYNDVLAFNDRFRKVFYGRLLGKLPYFEYGVYRQAHEVTEPTLEWLKVNADSPFFLFLHYYDPHYPYGIKPQRRRFERPMWIKIPRKALRRQKELYAKEVQAVDLQIGRVIEFLKKAGIYDQTLLLVTADHGESLGEHGAFYNHERYVYEQMIRVPMILRYPALIQAGTVFNKQVAVLDTYKTISGAAGVAPLPGNRGFDLIQLIRSGAPDYGRMIPSYHFDYKVEGIRSDEWKLIHNGKSKLDQFELYQLIQDPGETVNLVSRETEMVKKLIRFMSSKNNFIETDLEKLTDEQIEVLRGLGYLQ
jgi:arylsulfatase A-like enzyme